MTARIVVIRITQVVIDLLVLSLAIWLGFFIRFDWAIPTQMLKRLLFLWPYILGLEYSLLLAFGVPRYVWRYVGLREVSRILLATLTASGVLMSLRIGSALIVRDWGYARYALVPYGVIAINFVLALLGVVGVRAGRRWMSESRMAKSRRTSVQKVPTLLVGAGQCGLLVAKEISNRPEMGILPVGFVDDDPIKKGTLVHGIPVLGQMSSISELSQQRGAKQALITISDAPGSTVRRISDLCRRAGLDVKIIPGVYELVGGSLNLSRIRNVAIDDLLRREPVDLDLPAMASAIQGHSVLVSGAGGSIGSEICRQLCALRPARLALVERSENALFEIHRELSARFPELCLEPCVGDVGDSQRVRHLLREYSPRTIFHAAAHKHVPMVEANPGEGIKNNVGGTRVLADLAHEHEVESFVMISTDKAVRPASIMGASKRAAEIYIQALSQKSNTRFVTVRFGNVLGSAGSVIPIFKKQIAAGGPVTVTHPDMKRYFMTIPEATELVLQAATMGQGGEIFILDMGEPVRIVDLARDLIRLSGFEESEIPIEFTGVRPGEKLFEELSTASESAEKTRHPKIFVGHTTVADFADVEPLIDELLAAGLSGSPDNVRTCLSKVVSDYSPSAFVAKPTAPADPGRTIANVPAKLSPAI